MKPKKTIVEQYKKYLQTIKRPETDVVESFKKLMDFLEQHCNNARLTMAIELDSIHYTLVQVRKRGLKLKDYGEWNSIAVSRAYELLNNLRRDYNYGSGDSYKVNFHNLWELAEKQPSSVRLYIHLVHENSDDGKNLYVSEKELIEKLFNASSEEEVESVLSV